MSDDGAAASSPGTGRRGRMSYAEMPGAVVPGGGSDIGTWSRNSMTASTRRSPSAISTMSMPVGRSRRTNTSTAGASAAAHSSRTCGWIQRRERAGICSERTNAGADHERHDPVNFHGHRTSSSSRRRRRVLTQLLTWAIEPSDAPGDDGVHPSDRSWKILGPFATRACASA